MKELDINICFSFDGYDNADDVAEGIEFSNKLYKKIKKIYQSDGETYLNEILLSSKLSSDEAEELEEIMESLKEEIIDVQHSNGDDIDPETGEEYDFSDLIIDLEIVVPEDWEE